ncbi:hypothetical protein LINPERPRIM_LOCUS38139 [Linum perenne]
MGIKPIVSSPREIPAWVTFKKVPPVLVTSEGVGWLASQIGQPINKFVRDGLDVKVCVIRNPSEQVTSSLSVVLAGGEQRDIEIVLAEPRVYSGKGKQVLS